jgi:hypothetical protein
VNRGRIGTYVELISKEFEILDIIRPKDRFGVDLLTPEIEFELSKFSRDELLTNEILFVARKHG